ncbi:MAG: ThiF family adenylyltransferase [Nitrososphaerota archaeon]|nr:ThiF family adenylyltransferase [Nitrososphaerota archaeon]MDG6949750.1 ThiF family adenylyltransferase [Nitrososphaerota archaeon]
MDDNSPVAAGIVAPNGAWRVREYWWPQPTTPREARQRDFRSSGGHFKDVDFVKIVGPRRLRRVAGGPGTIDPLSQSLDSTLRLWGSGGQRILKQLRVGVAGAGGVGSYVVEALARLGVGSLVLVDFDRLKVENLNRAIGARRTDVGQPKVSYVERLARESATVDGLDILAFRASVAEWEGLRPLLDCDVILAAADSPVARQVLDHVSYAYQIPVVDGGTIFVVNERTGRVTGKSQVSECAPEGPCLECQGVYNREEVTLARESPELQGPNPYVRVFGKEPTETPRAPSVVSHNALVGSLMVQRLLRITLGFPPEEPGFQQRFYVELGEMKWGPKTACDAGCPKDQYSGLGDAHWVPVGVDTMWKRLREEEEHSSKAPPARKWRLHRKR